MDNKQIVLEILDAEFRRKHKKLHAEKDQDKIKKILTELETITEQMKKITKTNDTDDTTETLAGRT